MIGDDDFLALPPATPEPPKPKGKRGRPTREEVAAREAARQQKEAAIRAAAEERARDGDPDLEHLPPGALPDVSTFMRGCRITFLSVLFGTEPRRIEKKLANCPVMRWEQHKGKDVPVYDFRTAIAYLIEPRIDMETWIKSQTSLSLPPAINKAFWEAMRTKMRTLAEAGEYWHSSDVLEMLGRVAMTIKNATLLWTEELPDKVNLSNDNYHALRGQVEELLKQIESDLVEMPKQKRTLAIKYALERELEQSGSFLDDGD